MSIEGNKQAVTRFCAGFGEADIDGVLDMMTDDATWRVMGKPHLYSGAGIKTKAKMESIWRDMYAGFAEPLRMDVVDMVAEGDRVAAECRCHAVTRDGKVYQNDYHILFRLRDGRIAEVREYTDLMHAQEVLG